MEIEKLIWDTEFFGFNVGKIIIYDENDFLPLEFKKQAHAENYKLIYVFKYFKMFSWTKVIDAELEMVDIMLTMSKKFDSNDYKDIPFNFRTELSKQELKECYHIAEQTATVSRFYQEKNIGTEKTKALYRKWIDNALNKSFSDGLFLEKESNIVSGIHLIKTDKINKNGHFTLTGVNPKNIGQGIGKKLWLQSYAYWANEIKPKKIISPFSFQNFNSFNFHLKLGFNKIEDIKYIYHFRNNTIL